MAGEVLGSQDTKNWVFFWEVPAAALLVFGVW